MAVLTIRNLLRGLIKEYTGGSTSSFEGREGEYARSNGIDLYRQGFEGHITPSQVFSIGSISHANIDSHIRASAIDAGQTGGHVYLILGGLSGTAPRIERIENGSYATTATHAIAADSGDNFTTVPAGTGFWGEDIVLYNVSGTNRIFYSWCDSDDADVGTATLGSGGPSYDDVFLSGTLAAGKITAGVPHRMVVGSDGLLYIANGRYVIQYDGPNNTVNLTKYDAGAGWIVTDLRVYKNFLVIVSINCGATYRITNFNQNSRICLWNMVEPGLGLVYPIRDGNVSAAFVANDGRLYAFSQGLNQSVKLRVFNGSQFEVKKEWITTLYGTSPQPNSIEDYFGLIVWLPGDSLGGFILAYDPKYDALHIPFFGNDGTTDMTSAGIIKNLDAKNLYASLLVAGTYKLAYLNGAGAYASTKDLRTRVYRLPYKATISKIRVYFSQMASGSSVIVSLFKNYTAIDISGSADMLNQTLSFSVNGALTEFEINKTITGVSAFYMNFRVTGQISIAMVEVEYERLK